MSKGAGVSVAKSSSKTALKKKARPATKAKPARTAARKSPAKPKPKAKPAKKAAPKLVKKIAPIKKTPAKPALKIAPKIAPSAKPANGKPMSRKPTAKPDTKITSIKPANGKPVSSKLAKAPPSMPEIIPPPPPPRLKPAKNLAGLSFKELETFRDMLFAKRRELVGDMYSMEREALQRSGENLSNLPIHMADMGTDNYEQEFTLGLMEKDRQLLREINQALSKIMDGRFGMCEGTAKPISKARLEIQPWAKYSIEHVRKLENRGVR